MATAPKPKTSPVTRTLLRIFYALPVLFAAGLMGYLVWNKTTHQPLPVRQLSGNPFASVAIKDLTANLFTQGDHLRPAGNDLFVEFRDKQNHLTDVGTVSLILEMKMPAMVMHSIGKVFCTATAGQYRTMVEPQVAGDWTVTLGFDGPRGKTETNFFTNVR